ncbi:TadE/TadG family type IV pilus assembly protein [Lentzea cavernae]|uniref:Membrane protein n=1 Tax=Lentzea cavernae TaxID=2020703 RepID=A0ABQ3N0P5_9PSEU|nr:TadE/TadG family type IV pilus assembly protein [Lentzea cavernae]GHH62466.1 membrane protein [Lentzea cavernae]
MTSTRVWREDRGSAAAELTLVAPLMVLLVLFVVFCGRLAATQVRMNDVAHQAARAATSARTPTQAEVAARATAAASLAAAGITCRSLTVSVASAGLRPGSTVTVTVSCTVALEDVAALGVPGSRIISCSFSSVVDVWRGGGS